LRRSSASCSKRPTLKTRPKLAQTLSGQAQSVLGGLFDLTSGKIKSQNELLILNARLMALNLRSEAMKEHASAQGTFVGAMRRSASDQLSGTPGLTGGLVARLVGGTPVGDRNAAAARALLLGLGQGTVSRDDALKFSATMDFTGTKVTREQFQQALIDSASSQNKSRIADLIDQSLDSGSLASVLRQADTHKPRKEREKKDRTTDINRRFEDQLAGYTQQSLSAMGQLAGTTEEKAELQARALEWDRRHELERIETDKDFSDAQKAELSAAVERLTGYQRGVLEQKKQQELFDQQLQADTDTLDNQISFLRLQSQFADTLDERRRIARAAARAGARGAAQEGHPPAAVQ
jgi:hypothetical protein